MFALAEHTSPPKARREAGVALLITVLFTALVLVGILVLTTTLTLSSRSTVAADAQSYRALLASESGANVFLVKSRLASSGMPRGIPTTCTTLATAKAKATCAVQTWMQDADITTLDVEGGSVTFTPVNPVLDTAGDLASIDIQAASTVNNNHARVLKTYAITKSSIDLPSISGAVTSYPNVRLFGGAMVVGASATATTNDGIYNGMLTVTAANTTTLSAGTSLSVAVNASQQSLADQLDPGTYVRLPIQTLTGTTGTGTFRVTSNATGQLSVTPVATPTNPVGAVWQVAAGQHSLDYVYNGVKSYDDSTGNLTLTSAEAFYTGDTIAMTIGTVLYTAKVTTATSVGGSPKTSTVQVSSWSPSAPAVGSVKEGQPIRKSTNAVVTHGTYTEDGGADAIGEVLTNSDLVPSPTNDAMFIQTFGVDSATMSSYVTKIPEASFTGAVSNITWVSSTDGSINLNNEKVRGTGVLIIDGDLNINQNGTASETLCDFQGLIYIRGNLDLKGNLQVCGAVVVEGSVLEDGVVAGTDGTTSELGGNGRKISYSMDALMTAFAGIGPYQIVETAASWRQR